ncbi:MAG: HIT family protein [Candidatus Nanoarchaeia archaeon]|nr:HIT family protein [Candidatus Nanoarchaeia archaeon]
MTDCIFCKIIKKEIPASVVYEDKNTLAFLDINPVNPGHTLVISKKHFETLEEATEDSLVDIIKTVKKLIKPIDKALNPVGINIALSNKPGAGQVVPHMHFHIMPRFKGDGHELFEGKKASPETLKQVADKIKSLL